MLDEFVYAVSKNGIVRIKSKTLITWWAAERSIPYVEAQKTLFGRKSSHGRVGRFKLNIQAGAILSKHTIQVPFEPAGDFTLLSPFWGVEADYCLISPHISQETSLVMLSNEDNY